MRTGILIETYRKTVKAFGTYHGYEVAAHFSSPERELDAAVLRVGLLDHSFSGRLEIRGNDGLDFLHRLSTNDLLHASAGGVVGTVLTNEKGRVIDYATVAIAGDRIVLVVSPGNAGLVLSWLEKYHITEDIQFNEVTGDTAMLSLVGPEARTTVSDFFGIDIPTNRTMDLAGERGALTIIGAETSRLPVMHIIGDPVALGQVWSSLVSRKDGPLPIGCEAFEAYRISRGVAMTGSELTTAFNPFEVGLREAISFTKGCYIGQEVVARLDTYNKVQRKLVGLASSVPFARDGGPVQLFHDDVEVGLVTSATVRPFHGRYIGLGVVSADAVHEGDGLETRGSGKAGRVIVLHIPMLIQGASVA
jgi:tRNA-modifying protein YgfZ